MTGNLDENLFLVIYKWAKSKDIIWATRAFHTWEEADAKARQLCAEDGAIASVVGFAPPVWALQYRPPVVEGDAKVIALSDFTKPERKV